MMEESLYEGGLASDRKMDKNAKVKLAGKLRLPGIE
jgi:hypothetical protein